MMLNLKLMIIRRILRKFLSMMMQMFFHQEASVAADHQEAHEFLDKFQPKVADCSMSKILLKIVKGALYLKHDRKQAKTLIEEVEKELDGLGIVKAVHR